jgi:hypothetical protein
MARNLVLVHAEGILGLIHECALERTLESVQVKERRKLTSS